MKIDQMGTRSRLMLALIGLYVVLSMAYAYALYEVIERLEYELTHNVVARELQEFASAYRANHNAPAPSAAGLSAYVDGRDDARMPPQLRALPIGLRDEISLGGVAYSAGHAEVDGTGLYVLLNVEPVELLERELTAFVWTWFLLSLFCAVWVARWLATSISRPITRLSELLDRMPADASVSRLSPQFHEKDALIIAGAIDGYLDRLHGFVERERAFTEDASHELRTPLAVIESSATLLRDTLAQDPPALLRLERIERSSQIMRQAIEALLFLAREDGGASDVDCQVDDLVRDVLAARGIALDDVDTLLQPLVVRAHPGMAYIVIGNLVDNARQHGGGRLHISLHGNELVIADQGKGVPLLEQTKVFERRYKGAGSKGQGLGLSIVSKVCERLGWQVTLASSPDAGARVTLRFPAKN